MENERVLYTAAIEVYCCLSLQPANIPHQLIQTLKVPGTSALAKVLSPIRVFTEKGLRPEMYGKSHKWTWRPLKIARKVHRVQSHPCP